MPKAETDNTHSRRKFLGHLAEGAAVVAVASGASSIAQPAAADLADGNNRDAELIALCALHDDLQRQQDALFIEYFAKGIDVPDELLRPLHRVTPAILEMRATTPAGFMALARTLALYAPEMIEDPIGRPQKMLAMLLRDMTAAS